MNKIERIRQAALKAGIASGQATALPMHKLESFYDVIEDQVERDISDSLAIAHMDGWHNGYRFACKKIAEELRKQPLNDTANSIAAWIESYASKA